MNFKDLKLGTKQGVGFAIILVIMAGSHVYSTRKMAALNAEIDEVTTNWLPRAIAISDINLNTSELRRIQLQRVFATDETKQQELAIKTIELLDKINRNRDTYEQLKTFSEKRKLYSEQERELYSQFDQKWDRYQDLSISFFKHLRNKENQKALALLNSEAKEVFNDFSADLVKLVNVNKKDSFEAAKRADITYRSTHGIMIIIYVVTILLSVFIALGLVRFITVPVQQLEQAAGKVAKGDLTVQLDIQSRDEIGNLAQSFNQMTTSLRNTKDKTLRQAEKLRAQNRELKIVMLQLKDTQEQLLMKEKMAALGDLVAGVSHEINNPIGSVNSSTDVSNRCVNRIEHVLQKSATLEEMKHSRELREALKILKENINVTLTAGDRIATIVKSLKNFARLDEAEYQRVNIHEGLDSTLTLMGNELKDRISVIKEYGEIPEIVCNPGQLNQVFINLLKNASQAIENSGTIGIKTFKENNHIHVQISDTGKGIPHHKLRKIFDFGFSTGGSRIRMSSGLSTAFNIVQKHNGEINVESEVGKGTTFTIILPIT